MCKKRKQIWLDRETHESLVAYADAFSMTITNAANKIFKEYLSKKETKESAIRQFRKRMKT
jgi:hypothetical protein